MFFETTLSLDRSLGSLGFRMLNNINGHEEHMHAHVLLNNQIYSERAYENCEYIYHEYGGFSWLKNNLLCQGRGCRNYY